ncbi:MAG: phosphatidylserine/phosphatidylglycerophosphate/cardiolipin synthase family protein [Bacteroidales bacterium]|nr:phosphatidylserine/phosphatidylglycerophosphate/cardiolipin synthase family protein [Bacteroidales bacterium]MDZ4205389.1 phosphatidylserine/phosphatidylglycerophosphate/cardiolipin synthase family protein [Bacteroidales bacterium]
MQEEPIPNYQLFSAPPALYEAMLSDIAAAKDYICLETYKFGNDSAGNRFRKALTEKSREGVNIKILIDSWGGGVPISYFSEMIRHGAEVRYFQKIVLAFDFFTKNHRRTHRKLLIIDDKISYLGSANITGYSLDWRELQIRITGDMAHCFKKIFYQNFNLYQKYIFNKLNYRKAIHCLGFEIVQDMPSIYRQRIKKKFEELIKNAQKQILIETPYFIPGFKLRKALMDAAHRGVDVKVLMPQHSDVKIVDLLRNKYLGLIHRNKVKLLLYTPNNLHAKAMLVDDEIFCITSANFDYRSFRYQHEIALLGRQKEIIKMLKSHMEETLSQCIPFNYDFFTQRPIIQKIFEILLVPFRHLF